MEQQSRPECIELAAMPPRITNDFLEEHVPLIFSKVGVNIDKRDIAACQRLDSTDRTIAKLLDWKNAVKLLEKKPTEICRKTIRRIIVTARLVYLNRLRIERIAVIENLSILKPEPLSLLYRMLYGRVKKMAREGWIDSFWISNGTIKMK